MIHFEFPARELPGRQDGWLSEMAATIIKLSWSCSDFAKHEHKYWITAFVCGRIQKIIRIFTDKIFGEYHKMLYVIGKYTTK